MCGIAGIFQLAGHSFSAISPSLEVMGQLISHRGPDGKGVWKHPKNHVGFAHRRLSVVDLSEEASQPMTDRLGNWIAFNGEIYNFVELRKELGEENFKSQSDTEVILFAYRKWGKECVNHLRGMFAFALWDEKEQTLFCARDRFGIKPFYYSVIDGIFYFASEAKALLPFLPAVETDTKALAEYLTFQFNSGEQTMFVGVYQLLPAHMLSVNNGDINIRRYWDVEYEIDYDHTAEYFGDKLRELLDDSIKVHLRGDVPVGSYVSGGIDSSLMHLLAQKQDPSSLQGFHGRFLEYPGYDESSYAEKAVAHGKGSLHIADITAKDFAANLQNVVYHLDFPVAGPGSFPQYMVSKLAASQVKVVLGGQGGDEIFGGYARYVIAYFEQCIKAAIEGTYQDGNYVVTMESIIQNLGLLREYKPLIKKFWSQGLFESLDRRYFQLVNRSADMEEEIDWNALDMHQVFENFSTIFNNTANVKKEAYFDKMTHFDFKTLLPALLHVEDRMSMAHGLESRVPLLDHSLVEFVATIPADIKFKGGDTKHLLKTVFSNVLPSEIVNRRDKMGFPVPLKEWFANEMRDFVMDHFQDMANKHRAHINVDAVLRNFGKEAQFSRKTWGLLSLELWHQQFHDQAVDYRNLLRKAA